jgi:hypothetical protein
MTGFLTGMTGFSILRPVAGFLWHAGFFVVKVARRKYII